FRIKPRASRGGRRAIPRRISTSGSGFVRSPKSGGELASICCQRFQHSRRKPWSKRWRRTCGRGIEGGLMQHTDDLRSVLFLVFTGFYLLTFREATKIAAGWGAFEFKNTAVMLKKFLCCSVMLLVLIPL